MFSTKEQSQKLNIKTNVLSFMKEDNIEQIYNWILRGDLEAMGKYYDAKRANQVDLGRLYLNWNKLARGYQ